MVIVMLGMKLVVKLHNLSISSFLGNLMSAIMHSLKCYQHSH